MYKLVQGDSTEYFKSNNVGDISLIITSPSYYTDTPKRNTLTGEIGVGEDKQDYVNLVADVLISSSKELENNSKIILVLGRYGDVSIEPIILNLADKLSKVEINLCGYKMFNKGDHESVVVFNKGESQQVFIPAFTELQVYDKVGFFGKINNEILDWAINNLTVEGDLIVDPFAGAGNTLKRANQLNRRGFGVELNPKYIE